MEVFSKILTATDAGVRLSLPASTVMDHFGVENRGQSLDFQVMDHGGKKLWTFRLSTRENGYPKAVLTRGWIDFVKEKELERGDKVIFLVQGQGNDEQAQFQIQVLRKRRLFGRELWALV